MTEKIIIPHEKISMRRAMRDMGIGESVAFPIESRSSIRTYCCEYGFEWKRKFKSKTDRTSRSIIVTRLA